MEWTETTKDLPEMGRIVLAYNGTRIFTAMRFKFRDVEYFNSSICTCCELDSCGYNDPITHWMPLAQVPE